MSVQAAFFKLLKTEGFQMEPMKLNKFSLQKIPSHFQATRLLKRDSRSMDLQLSLWSHGTTL